VPVPPLSQQGAASFHASMPSAKGCYILFVSILNIIRSPVAVKQLDSILVSLRLALGIKSLRIEFKSEASLRNISRKTLFPLFQAFLFKRGFPALLPSRGGGEAKNVDFASFCFF
jgi:hypothetical protein